MMALFSRSVHVCVSEWVLVSRSFRYFGEMMNRLRSSGLWSISIHSAAHIWKHIYIYIWFEALKQKKMCVFVCIMCIGTYTHTAILPLRVFSKKVCCTALLLLSAEFRVSFSQHRIKEHLFGSHPQHLVVRFVPLRPFVRLFRLFSLFLSFDLADAVVLYWIFWGKKAPDAYLRVHMAILMHPMHPSQHPNSK